MANLVDEIASFENLTKESWFNDHFGLCIGTEPSSGEKKLYWRFRKHWWQKSGKYKINSVYFDNALDAMKWILGLQDFIENNRNFIKLMLDTTKNDKK